jgi:hypothetical protein
VAIQTSEQLTPREYETMNYEKEMYELQAAHAVKIKELDIQAAKLEAKISSWFRLPVTIVKLPLFLLMVVPLTAYAVKGKKVPAEYWTLLR